MSDNPYQPPKSPLDPESAPKVTGGTLEGGLAGRYQLDIAAIIREAWTRTDGAKGRFWMALLLTGVFVLMLVGVGISLFGVPSASESKSNLLREVFNVLQAGFMAPLSAGLALMGVQRAVGLLPASDLPFRIWVNGRHFRALFLIAVMLAVVGVVVVALAKSGSSTLGATTVLLYAPLVYLNVVYQFAPLLIVEKGMGLWQALETSRKAVTHQFMKVLLLLLVMGLAIGFIGVFTLGIAFIWLLPMYLCALGIVYREIFGVQTDGAAPTPTPEPDGRMMA